MEKEALKKILSLLMVRLLYQKRLLIILMVVKQSMNIRLIRKF